MLLKPVTINLADVYRLIRRQLLTIREIESLDTDEQSRSQWQDLSSARTCLRTLKELLPDYIEVSLHDSSGDNLFVYHTQADYIYIIDGETGECTRRYRAESD